MKRQASSAASIAIPHILERAVRSGPAALASPAVTFRDTTWTYEQLADQARRTAEGLTAAGLSHGERVAIMMRNNIEWFAIFFGSAMRGIACVPVNFLLKAPECRFMLEDSGARVLIFDESCRAVVEELRAEGSPVERYVYVGPRCPPWATPFDALPADGPGDADDSVESHDLLLILYTSGTTGVPKGAMHTQGSFVWNAYHQIVDIGAGPDDRWLLVTSLCWAAGFVTMTLSTLWMGGHVVVRPSMAVRGEDVIEDLERHAITKTLLVPTVLKDVVEALEARPRPLPALRTVISGSAPVPLDVIERLQRLAAHVDIIQAYGTTEGGNAGLLPASRARDKPGSAGLPSSIHELRIVDATGRELAAGEQGEVLIRGPGLMSGYWNLPEATADAMADGWFHTGDIGELDEDGFLYLHGRSKDVYISGALNVYPAEVEHVIQRHEAVREAAVLGVPSPRWGEVGLAVVVPREAASVQPEELDAFCRKQLANYKVPHRWHIERTPLPRTVSGKVMKHVLRDLLAERMGA